MSGVKFANPEVLWFLVIVPILLVWYIWKLYKNTTSISFSSSIGFDGLKSTLKQKLRHLNIVLRLLAISLLIVALARPQSNSSRKSVTTDGIDIVLAMDVSTSMLAEDLKPNRIEAAKKTAIKFVESRENDRIGLVIFSGESFTQCPVTIDHSIVKNLIKNIKTGVVVDGTAIGQGLATSVSRLKDSKAKSKVIILLTDGVNNMGVISPETAADIARTFGIRVYTIGVGTKGMAPYPVKTLIGIQYQNVEVQIDDELLNKIAKSTNGEYNRATNNKSLEAIYKKIDQMEKTKVDVAYFSKYTEEFFPWAFAGLAIFMLELLLKYLYFKTLP
ncbi:MAG: VWA domain-containing protein [Candidatus Kapabacteria bacterium]|nr:VWA domain-containing protein [Candidatus Kapabacteria bacterium]